MASQELQPIVLRVASVDQIFNPPDANPFSTNEGDALGEAALERALTRLQLHPLDKSAGVPLVVMLPPDQITHDLQQQLTLAIQRYCSARIEDNRLQIHLSRVRNAVGMVIVTLIVLLALLLAILLLATVLKDAPSIIRGMITAGVSVFAWVILWDPMEALLFNWVEPARENRALRRIMSMNVEVQPLT
jgi:hypothetical protein